MPPPLLPLRHWESNGRAGPRTGDSGNAGSISFGATRSPLESERRTRSNTLPK